MSLLQIAIIVGVIYGGVFTGLFLIWGQLTLRKSQKEESKCQCKTRLRGVHEDNFGFQECGDCQLPLPKQYYNPERQQYLM